MTTTLAQWDMFETSLMGPSAGNPFIDVQLDAVFSQHGRSVRVPGFYDGEGIYKVRFMPDNVGEWSYITRSATPELDGRTGSFTVTAPRPDNHGPVQVGPTASTSPMPMARRSCPSAPPATPGPTSR